MKGEAIELREVSKTYRVSNWFSVARIEALKNFSLKIREGEIVGLLGLNGAGKTTLMKILCGLICPSGGEALVRGAPPWSPASKEHIGYLPELPYFHPNMNAPRTLGYYLRLSGKDPFPGKIGAVLETVGLARHASKKVSEFSKGMKQRLGLAQALVHEPSILLLDEPVSGLDPLAIHEIRNLITRLNGEGKTVFLSSHSISELEKVAGRVVILSRGKMISEISRNEWTNNPAGLEKMFIEALKDEPKE